MKQLESIVDQIHGLERKSVANVIEVGRLLEEANAVCEHGNWATWLRKNFEWSDRCALRYRDLYKASLVTDFSGLTVSAAYRKVANGKPKPESEQEAKRIERVASVLGNAVIKFSAADWEKAALNIEPGRLRVLIDRLEAVYAKRVPGRGGESLERYVTLEQEEPANDDLHLWERRKPAAA